jgi:hypothetical protein
MRTISTAARWGESRLPPGSGPACAAAPAGGGGPGGPTKDALLGVDGVGVVGSACEGICGNSPAAAAIFCCTCAQEGGGGWGGVGRRRGRCRGRCRAGAPGSAGCAGRQRGGRATPTAVKSAAVLFGISEDGGALREAGGSGAVVRLRDRDSYATPAAGRPCGAGGGSSGLSRLAPGEASRTARAPRRSSHQRGGSGARCRLAQRDLRPRFPGCFVSGRARARISPCARRACRARERGAALEGPVGALWFIWRVRRGYLLWPGGLAGCGAACLVARGLPGARECARAPRGSARARASASLSSLSCSAPPTLRSAQRRRTPCLALLGGLFSRGRPPYPRCLC